MTKTESLLLTLVTAMTIAGALFFQDLSNRAVLCETAVEKFQTDYYIFPKDPKGTGR